MHAGTIINPKRARQPTEFRNIQFMKNNIPICPTDADGIYDIEGRIWIMYETKLENNPEPPEGQKLLFQHFIEMAQDAKRCAMVLVTKHSVYDTTEAVDLAKCIVTKIYCTQKYDRTKRGERWLKPRKPDLTALEATIDYLNFCNSGITMVPIEVS